MHELPKLEYEYNALEPHIDAQTMELHHAKHHQGYVNGLNKALQKLEEARKNKDFSLIKFWEKEVAFHGSGHFLHKLFWNSLSPNGGKEPSGKLKELIEQQYGDFETFKAEFIAAGTAVEGSGWAILAIHCCTQELQIITIEKHSDVNVMTFTPLFAIDVWEHAYYLKYQNKRGDYLQAVFNVANWAYVEKKVEHLCCSK